MTIVGVLLGSILCAIFGQLMLKTAMNRIGRIDRTRGALAWRAGLLPLAAGIFGYGISTVLWLFALSRVPLSYAFPFISLSYVGIVLSARFALGERLDGHRLAGSLLIVLGVICVGFS